VGGKGLCEDETADPRGDSLFGRVAPADLGAGGQGVGRGVSFRGELQAAEGAFDRDRGHDGGQD